MSRLIAVLIAIAGFVLAAPASASAEFLVKTFPEPYWADVFWNPPPPNFTAIGCNQTTTITAGQYKYVSNLCNAATGSGTHAIDVSGWACARENRVSTYYSEWRFTPVACDFDHPSAVKISSLRVWVATFSGWTRAVKWENKGTVGEGLGCYTCAHATIKGV